MSRWQYFFYFKLTLVCLLISACKEKPHAPPLTLLAQEAKFLIGGHQVQVPLVAITTFGRPTVAITCKQEAILRACGVSLLEVSKHATVPISVISIGIQLQNYSTYQDAYTDQYVDLSKICSMLSREWSKQICDGKLKPFTDNGLAIERFTLVENDAFYALESHSVGGYRESLPSILNRITAIDKKPNVYCETGQLNCIVKMKLEENLIAVWTTSSIYKENINIQAETIRGLVEYGFGEEEDFPSLRAKLLYNRQLH